MAPEAQLQARRGSPWYPQGHGFMAAMRVKLAGKLSVPAARASVTMRSSSGWRSPSSLVAPNSGLVAEHAPPGGAHPLPPGGRQGPAADESHIAGGVMRGTEGALAQQR